jgi:hypothetical protein
MKLVHTEGRQWCLYADDGRLLAGPFESRTEALLAELELWSHALASQPYL